MRVPVNILNVIKMIRNWLALEASKVLFCWNASLRRDETILNQIRHERTVQTIDQIIDVQRDHGWTQHAIRLQ